MGLQCGSFLSKQLSPSFLRLLLVTGTPTNTNNVQGQGIPSVFSSSHLDIVIVRFDVRITLSISIFYGYFKILANRIFLTR